MNEFIQNIYDNYSDEDHIEFIKEIKSSMPDLGMIWKMADFVKFAELSYFYRNSPKEDKVYSSTLSVNTVNDMLKRRISSIDDMNHLGIHTEEVSIVYLLDDIEKSTTIIIKRPNNFNNTVSKLTFYDNIEEDVTDIKEELLLDNIVSVTLEQFLILYDNIRNQRVAYSTSDLLFKNELLEDDNIEIENNVTIIEDEFVNLLMERIEALELDSTIQIPKWLITLISLAIPITDMMSIFSIVFIITDNYILFGISIVLQIIIYIIINKVLKQNNGID